MRHHRGVEVDVGVLWCDDHAVEGVPTTATREDTEVTAGHLDVVVVDETADAEHEESEVEEEQEEEEAPGALEGAHEHEESEDGPACEEEARALVEHVGVVAVAGDTVKLVGVDATPGDPETAERAEHSHGVGVTRDEAQEAGEQFNGTTEEHEKGDEELDVGDTADVGVTQGQGETGQGEGSET